MRSADGAAISKLAAALWNTCGSSPANPRKVLLCCVPAGELAAFAVDPSLSLLAVATNRSTLLLHRMTARGGKPTASAAGSCRAHVAGMAITKVCTHAGAGV